MKSSESLPKCFRKRAVYMDNKFSKFYFSDDLDNHDISEMKQLFFENNRDKTVVNEKYEGKIFCYVCHKAPLNINFGPDRQFLSVLKSNQSLHEIGCWKSVDEADKKEVNHFLSSKEIDKSHINKRLELFLSSIFRSLKQTSKVFSEASVGHGLNEINSLTIETSSRVQKNLPRRKLTTDLRDEGKSDSYKIYYGICKLYLYAYKPKDNETIAQYYLKILDNTTNTLICELSISPFVYYYISQEISEKIPCGYFAKKAEYLKYVTSHKIAFVSKMNVEINGNFKNVRGKLDDSRMLFID